MKAPILDIYEPHLLEVIEFLDQIENDLSVPRNVRIKIKEAGEALKDNNHDLAIKINKALQQIDEISDNQNIPSYTRTQIWHIVTKLESIK